MEKRSDIGEWVKAVGAAFLLVGIVLGVILSFPNITFNLIRPTFIAWGLQ
jgi:hypothetical protein